GSFWNYFSLSESGLNAFVQKKYSEFSLRSLNPLCVGESILPLAKYFPKSTFADAIRLWHLVSEYVDGYVDLYYPRDEDVGKDRAFQEFLDKLSQSLPNGKVDLSGRSKAECKRLLAEIIYGLSVRHHISTTTNWNFLTHPGHMATQVPKHT